MELFEAVAAVAVWTYTGSWEWEGAWLVVVVQIICAGGVGWVVYHVFDLALLTLTETFRGINDNEEAIGWIREVVSQAEEKVEIFDDGDDFEESVYNDSGFIDMIHNKVNENKNLTVLCLFNEDSPRLKFRQEFKGNTRVDIRVLSEGSPPGHCHYKIIDDGKMAYLSEHEAGSRDRQYRVIDTASGFRKWKRSEINSILDERRQDETLFEQVRGGRIS